MHQNGLRRERSRREGRERQVIIDLVHFFIFFYRLLAISFALQMAVHKNGLPSPAGRDVRMRFGDSTDDHNVNGHSEEIIPDIT